MRAVAGIPSDRLFPLALLASIAIHGAALLVLRRAPAPSPRAPEASVLSVQIVEPDSTTVVEHRTTAVTPSGPLPLRRTPPVAKAPPAVLGESQVAAREAAIPAVREEELSPAHQEAAVSQVTSAAREPADTVLLVREYADAVSRYLEARKRYPPAALARGWHGVVTLELEVLRAGDLDLVEVLHSSGYPLLDSTAVSIAKSAQPFPAFSPALPAKVSIHIDVVFRIAN